jgi:NAD(P)-dependent dehydrogenase (short-subunit alcohol dehydrogenase family)
MRSDPLKDRLSSQMWLGGRSDEGGQESCQETQQPNQKVVARLPGGEWAEPEDLAGVAIFLASPALKLINGVTIPVDGGYTAS